MKARALADLQGHWVQGEVVHLIVVMEEVRTEIVGGLERGVVVVCSLPADGLKDPAKIRR